MLYYPLSFKGQVIYRISYCSPYLFYICLFAFHDEMTVSGQGGRVGVLYCDFSKVFGRVSHPSAQLTSEIKTG